MTELSAQDLSRRARAFNRSVPDSTSSPFQTPPPPPQQQQPTSVHGGNRGSIPKPSAFPHIPKPSQLFRSAAISQQAASLTSAIRHEGQHSSRAQPFPGALAATQGSQNGSPAFRFGLPSPSDGSSPASQGPQNRQGNTALSAISNVLGRVSQTAFGTAVGSNTSSSGPGNVLESPYARQQHTAARASAPLNINIGQFRSVPQAAKPNSAIYRERQALVRTIPTPEPNSMMLPPPNNVRLPSPSDLFEKISWRKMLSDRPFAPDPTREAMEHEMIQDASVVISSLVGRTAGLPSAQLRPVVEKIVERQMGETVLPFMPGWMQLAGMVGIKKVAHLVDPVGQVPLLSNPNAEHRNNPIVESLSMTTHRGFESAQPLPIDDYELVMQESQQEQQPDNHTEEVPTQPLELNPLIGSEADGETLHESAPETEAPVSIRYDESVLNNRSDEEDPVPMDEAPVPDDDVGVAATTAAGGDDDIAVDAVAQVRAGTPPASVKATTKKRSRSAPTTPKVIKEKKPKKEKIIPDFLTSVPPLDAALPVEPPIVPNEDTQQQ